MSAETYMVGFAEVIMQLWFSRQFLRSGVSAKYYLPLAVTVDAAVNFIPMGYLARSVIFVLILFLSGTAVMGADKKAAAICAVTSAVIMQLCFGLCACAEGIISDLAYTPAAAFISVVGNVLPLVLSYLCYKLLMLKTPSYTDGRNCPIAVIFPLILIFGLDLYINNFVYGNTVDTENIAPIRLHSGLLVVRALCLASVMCILWAYGKIILLGLSEREYRLNKQYAERSKSLYDKTVSFRHDIKNHLLVIRGLIDKKEYEKAKLYAEKLYGKTDGISFGYSTGRPAADVILEEKFAAATDTLVKCEMKLPDSFEIDDIDLCVIISNAVDNAVSAVNKLSENKYISLSCKQGGDMVLFEFENSYDGKPFTQGIGISNIKAAAEKYGGNFFISTSENKFSLKILFISRH